MKDTEKEIYEGHLRDGRHDVGYPRAPRRRSAEEIQKLHGERVEERQRQNPYGV